MRTKSFSNYSERRTHRIIETALQETQYWVNCKTRLEDVIDPDPSDSKKDEDFLRDAHFDFTLHTKASDRTIWAFEFDGPMHRTNPAQIGRDIRKNRICALARLPILRFSDEFIDTVETEAILSWLIKRWIVYETEMGGLLRQQERGDFDLLSAEEVFDLEHPYPAISSITHRLLHMYGIRDLEEFPLFDPVKDPDLLGPAKNAKWHMWMPCGGPLPDLTPSNPFGSGYECEILVYPSSVPTKNAESACEFRARGTYAAEVYYPTRRNQSGPYDGPPFLFAGPPYGGSPWAISNSLSRYNALKIVETWAKRELGR